MADLFTGRDLFGNVKNTKDLGPVGQYETGVTSADYGGGSSQLNYLNYATPASAQNAANLLGGTVQQGTYFGTRPSTPELGIAVPGSGVQLNAGRVNQQLDYARRGRYNADTGQYDAEPLDVVLNRLRADAAPPLTGNASYIGMHVATPDVRRPYRAAGPSPAASTPSSPASPPNPPAVKPPSGGGTGPAPPTLRPPTLSRRRTGVRR